MQQIEMEFSDFASAKDYKKFVNSIKGIVRRTPEYQEWVRFIKFTVGLDYCQITKETSEDLTVDLHHHPIALQHIVESVLDTRLAEHPITSLDIAKEVLQLHYHNNVGHVLLISSLHEKFHNGSLQIPMKMIHGNWHYLLDHYAVSEEVKQLIDKYSKVTELDLDWLKESYKP